MTEFKSNEDNHEYINLLFDEAAEINLMRQDQPQFEFKVISGKEEARAKSMLFELNNATRSMCGYMSNAVKYISVTQNEEEKYLKLLGLPINGKRIGLTICKNCLDRAILMIEDNLNIMKNIRDKFK